MERCVCPGVDYDSAIVRIAVATNLFPPDVSGTASYSGDIARVLSEHEHDVFLIVPHRPDAPDWSAYGVRDRARVLELPSWRVPPTKIMLGFNQLRSVHKIGAYNRVKAFLHDHQVEFVYQQSHAFDTAYYTRRACRSLGIGRAIAHHTNIMHPSPLTNRLLRWAERNILGRFHLKPDDLWICPDSFTETYCQERFPRMARAKVMYGVRQLPACDDPAVMARARQFRQAHDPLILSMGHVTGCRDRVDLIQAVALLKDRYPRIGMVVIGDTQVTYPIDKAREAGLSAAVHFLGKTPRQHLRPYLDVADVEAHWYIDASTFGVATLEAMACGLCCLSNCPEDCYGPGLFREGIHYRRVQSGDPRSIADSLTELFDNRELRGRIAEQGARLVSDKLGWRAVANELVGAFREHAGRLERAVYVTN